MQILFHARFKLEQILCIIVQILFKYFANILSVKQMHNTLQGKVLLSPLAAKNIHIFYELLGNYFATIIQILCNYFANIVQMH